MVIFRSVPSGQLWKGYSVLYAPVSSDDYVILNTLKENGVENVTSLSGQYLPVLYKSHSLEVSMIPLNPNASAYLTDRENYFYDKSKQYRLYYIPVAQKSELATCVIQLRERGISCGIDLSAPYPWILPVLSVVFFLFLLFLAKNRLLFFISSVLPAVFPICFPFLSSLSSVCILMIFLYALSNIVGRRGLFDLIARNILLFVLLFISIFASFTQNIISGVFYILCLVNCLLAVYSYNKIQELQAAQSSFNPVLIRSVFFISKYNRNEKIIFPFAFIVIILSFVVCVFFMDSFSTQASKLSLPSANAVTRDDKLTDLKDYADWKWEVQSFPYRNVNLENDKLSYIKFPRYSEIDGKITESYDIVSFNESYVLKSRDDIKELPYNALEKMLLSQTVNSEDIVPGYSLSVSYQLSFFTIIMIILQLLVLSMYFIKTAFSRGRR